MQEGSQTVGKGFPDSPSGGLMLSWGTDNVVLILTSLTMEQCLSRLQVYGVCAIGSQGS